MVQLTRLNHLPLVINSDLIEYIEATPDTVITLITGQKIMVLETSNEVVEQIVRFRRRIVETPLSCPWFAASAGSHLTAPLSSVTTGGHGSE
ncbi:MAG: flagellar FlbD family protein [Bryobacteraceae bacterium]|nr:flagellar FlbD family protein [Bryobacterales bacterium]MEB2362583.1 flagellar FlbD family protein [Bryobacterales bacterium]NUN02270.1 flagellar FlbD family protein [Bryobacteraceae bacterium]